MKLDIVKVCAGLIILLALLTCLSAASETTWRHSGFECWGYDINMSNLNISNAQLVDAKCINGITNAGEYDTIQDAINATAYSGTLIIPVGSYTESLTISKPINIIGSKGVLLNNPDATGTVITISAVDVQISGLTIINQTGQQTAGNGILINNSHSVSCRINLNNLNIINQHTGINISGGYSGFGFYMDKLDIRNSVEYGIYICGGNDHYISNTILDRDPGYVNTTAQIKITCTGATWIHNVDALHGTRNLHLEGTPGLSIVWMFISNSAFDSATENGYNILIDGIAGGDITGITFTNCWASTADNTGLFIREAEGVRWTAGRIINNDKDGIVLSDGAKNISIDNSDIISNSLESIGTYYNIAVADGVSDYSITNNHIGTMWGHSGLASYGVYLTGTVGDRYIITGNTIINNVNGAISGGVLSSTQLITNNVADVDIIGNQFWNTTTNTLDCYDGTTLRYCGNGTAK